MLTCASYVHGILGYHACHVFRYLIRLNFNHCFNLVLFCAAVFTARCTLVQSAVLRSHVVCLSVCLSLRLSVTLVDCDHIGWNYSKIISPLVNLGCSLLATPT